MTDMQLLTIVITLIAILGSVWWNRKGTEDMRDVLKAEAKAQGAELRENFNGQFAELKVTLLRIENKLDHYAVTQASHHDRLVDLEKRGGK